MKQEKKHHQSKKESVQIHTKKQILKQENEDFGLKIQKTQKEIASLNLEIQYLIRENQFKRITQVTLQKQRKTLENCFLFKNLEISMQSGAQNQKTQTCFPRQTIKKQFKDVNERIVRFIEQLEGIKQNKDTSLIQEKNLDSENQPSTLDRKLKCQSLHLKQIFNPEETLNHEKKSSKLRQKLSFLYQKIHLNLEREQPYLHEKIFERIKRQAQSQTRKKMLQQIDKLIKQNSIWISQETNRVNNQLEEQKVQQICVNNLGLMKKIMTKKVANNDWIFQNYGDSRFQNESNATFPVQKISRAYQEVLKKFHENRVADQLSMVKNRNTFESLDHQKGSLKQAITEKMIQKFLLQSDETEGEFKQSQQNLLEEVGELQRKIEQMQKH